MTRNNFKTELIQNYIKITRVKSYSVSSNSKSLIKNISSIINNMKRDVSTHNIIRSMQKYITTRGDKQILYLYEDSDHPLPYKRLVSLTSDINELIECLFYISIKFKSIESIIYLLTNHVNESNREKIFDICKECKIKSLIHIISRYALMNNKKKLRNNLKEIFYYEEYRIWECNFNIKAYFKFIKKNKLKKFVDKRLKVKGIIKVNNIVGNYIIYCEVISYNNLNRSKKYVAITFNLYTGMCFDGRMENRRLCNNRSDSCDSSNEDSLSGDSSNEDSLSGDSYRNYCSWATMKCKYLNKLPVHYNFVPKKPIRICITPGTYEFSRDKIVNKLFSFTDMNGIDYYPAGHFYINFSLFKQSVMFIKRFKYYKHYSSIHKRIQVRIKKEIIPKFMLNWEGFIYSSELKKIFYNKK